MAERGKSGGGEGGIRTHGTRKGTPHFECGAIDHSTTSPHARSPRWWLVEPGGRSVGGDIAMKEGKCKIGCEESARCPWDGYCLLMARCKP